MHHTKWLVKHFKKAFKFERLPSYVSYVKVYALSHNPLIPPDSLFRCVTTSDQVCFYMNFYTLPRWCLAIDHFLVCRERALQGPWCYGSSCLSTLHQKSDIYYPWFHRITTTMGKGPMIWFAFAFCLSIWCVGIAYCLFIKARRSENLRKPGVHGNEIQRDIF